MQRRPAATPVAYFKRHVPGHTTAGAAAAGGDRGGEGRHGTDITALALWAGTAL